ncbi:DUF1178 family protein [Acidovorax sp. NCPPB 3576]|uniref:DUF1178 family protein n=1 Tax=Acidovorax sp. NCPPB 3576 TaxID=2940488 RepID=UPI00234B7873|nr:DUF1178 family protein [Acidovorax sp. NCPPB 3576]WCM89659.1 DUF1178 family protein [Acidovorax sp. NCPPB 3576]
MKVLDLHCAQGHAFEGWFGSEADFQSQLARDLVQCPLCGSSEIRKGLSAPRLNLGASPSPAAAAARASEADAAGTAVAAPPSMPMGDAALHAAWLRMARHIVANTEDVGPRFAQEARRMHHGEAEERGIRGQASAQEAAQLLEEGIAVLPLALPDAAKKTLQ